MLEEITKFCRENKIDASIPNLNEILITHSAVVETLYGFLTSQSLEKTQFIATFIQYCENIENIAYFAKLLMEHYALTPENVKIALENLDTLNIIYMADQNRKQVPHELDDAIKVLKSQKKSAANAAIISSMEANKKNLEILQSNLKEKYNIYNFKDIRVADCLAHLDLLKSIFEQLKENQLFDDEHILAVTMRIDTVALAMACINNNSTLTDENKKKYLNLLIQNPMPQVLGLIKILSHYHLLTEANLKMLFEKCPGFETSTRIEHIFPVETSPDAVPQLSDFDQELFEIFVNHPRRWYQMKTGLRMLYDFYGLTPTEEETPDSSGMCTFDGGMTIVNNKNEVIARINALKEKVAPQFLQDRKWICEHPKYADTISQIILIARRAKLTLSDDKLKSLLATQNRRYFKKALYALNCLHPQVDKNGFSFTALLEASGLSPVRNAKKENKLTQEIFDAICEDPSEAMKIAFENGIQMTGEEKEDCQMAEKIGVSLGAACEKPENTLPVGAAKLIGFWACENKLDDAARDNVVAENYYASQKLSQKV